MLVQLVRPLVRTQIQMLAKTLSASSQLQRMISQWLGYLGIEATVHHLQTVNGKIQVSMTVGQPEQCSAQEWQQILDNIDRDAGSASPRAASTYSTMTSRQQSKVHRLLAQVIRSGYGEEVLKTWEGLQAQLDKMGMQASMQLGIKSALKVATPLDLLLDELDTDLAAFVLSWAIGIALLDQRISPDEDATLKALYRSLQAKAMV